MAQQWYPWSAGLEDWELARALAAAAMAPEAVSEEEATAAILDQLASGLPLLLADLPAPNEDWSRALSPSDFASAWSAVWVPEPFRTAAVPATALLAPGADRNWFDDLRRLLLGTDFDSVVVHSRWKGPAGRSWWSWPVRIGVLSEDGTLGRFARFRRHRWSGKLFHLTRARGSRQGFDLLLVNGPDTLAGTATCTATAVVLLGDPATDLAAEIGALSAAREAVEAPVAVRQPAPDEPDRWLHDMVEDLAHSGPLHHVLGRIWRRSKAPAPPLVLGDRRVLAELDLEHGADRIRARARRLAVRGVGQQEVRLSSRLQGDLNLGSVATVDDVADRLDGLLNELVYHREEQGATTLGEVAAAVTRGERAADRARAAGDLEVWGESLDVTSGPLRGATRGASTDEASAAAALRVLRARLRAGETSLRHRPLHPDTSYVIEASIGPPAEDWLGLPAPFLTPEAPPDDPDQGWLLRVVVWEPTWIPQPVEQELWLPPAGPTKTVSFRFRTGSNPGPLGARITVLHDNRVLQTGLLASRGDDPELSWTVDAAPEPQLGALDPDRWFSASLIVNDDATGKSRLTVVADNELGLVDLDPAPLKKFTETVSGQLNHIAENPELYETLDSSATVSLLRSLAQHGWNLYETLLYDTGIDAERMARAERIQIVSARSTSYFPAEFLYSFAAPARDAELCPGAAAALVSEEDPRCHHPHTRAHVCPTGFWSLSKVVERHAFTKQDLDQGAPFALYDATQFPEAPTVDPLRHLLFAASQKVDGFEPTATTDLRQRASTVAGGLTAIDSQASWEQSVRNDRPSLFVLLPHHFRRDTHEQFEIGPTLVIQPSDLRKELVRREDGPRPLVLLIGCETVDTRIVFDSFVQKFRRYGASVVISTFATILGRHAAPATSELLEELHQRLAAGPVRLGDVLFDIRRKLLAKGTPMVLGLTSYGDADVLLARE